jgi:MoaA/NifB/PqqE/SkfB family radical SAM enzyme
LCKHCYQEVDASVSFRGDGVWLTKNCAVHGEQSIRIEEDAGFYRQSLVKGPDKDSWYALINVTALEVTQRCNVQCPQCYALPDNSAQDPSIDELVEIARNVKKGDEIILMGAEPTMRTDLPELVTALKREHGKPVGIYTNAIRLAGDRYCDRVSEVIDSASVSLHMRDYLPDEGLFDKKLQGINNLFEHKVPVSHISFSLRTLDDLDEVFEHCRSLWGRVHHFRIRTPSRIGVCEDEPFYLSRLFKDFVAKVRKQGMNTTLLPSDNNPYHVNVLVNEQIFRLIHLPSIEEVNLDFLQMPPYALFIPSLGETHVIHQFLLQEPLKLAAASAAGSIPVRDRSPSIPQPGDARDSDRSRNGSLSVDG